MKYDIDLAQLFSDDVDENGLGLDLDCTIAKELPNALVNRYPELGRESYSETIETANHAMVFLNDDLVSAPGGMDSELENGDNLILSFPISGG